MKMMKNRQSLQLKLTLMTALMVIAACLSLSFFIGKSALVSMDELGNSVIAIFPEEFDSEILPQEMSIPPDATEALEVEITKVQMEFWSKSILITAIITLISSTFVYIAIGHALKPLQQLGKRVEEVQAKNLQEHVESTSKSIEIVRFTDAFNGMLERLGEAFFLQKQFSANVAHELRTPLAVMQTKLEVFKKQKNPSEEENKEIFEMVETQIERLSHVVNILLEMTELQLVQRNDKVSLSELVEEVLCDLTTLGKKKKVTLYQEPGNAIITGSDALIYRAVYNLVENAIKYNKTGGQVIVAVKDDDGFARVIISDTGSGIDQENYRNIFEPFFRVDKSRSRSMGGAGLGLALVKEIASQHGGTARVIESSENGTKIEMTLRKF